MRSSRAGRGLTRVVNGSTGTKKRVKRRVKSLFTLALWTTRANNARSSRRGLQSGNHDGAIAGHSAADAPPSYRNHVGQDRE
jgi:hypothetical protein